MLVWGPVGQDLATLALQEEGESVAAEEPPDKLPEKLPEELPAGGDTAVRWLSDWVYDHDVPLLGQITDRNAARYPLRPRGPLRMRVRVEGRR